MGVHITMTSLEGNLTVSLKTENVHYPPTQEFDLEEFILQIELHMCAVVNVQKELESVVVLFTYMRRKPIRQ